MNNLKRIKPEENVLSDDILTNKKKKQKPKIRNYSFQKSKRLPIEKMTEISGIKIPSMPGSCYHAIISALAENKDKFCLWDKVIDLTHRNMRMYGGESAWQKFVGKNNVKSYEQRIKDNAHTLTRTGKDCYGYRLHEQGMSIYYFKDGAMLLTGGELKELSEGKYDVVFPNGRCLQTRYRGTTMTYKEYLQFLEKQYIDATGRILEPEKIRKFRSKGSNQDVRPATNLNVCVILNESFDQNTANRLEKLGLVVEQALGNELIGTVAEKKIQTLKADVDVQDVEVSGQ